MDTRISVAKSLRGDTASVSGSLSCTSSRGWLRVFIQLQSRKTQTINLSVSVWPVWSNIWTDVMNVFQILTHNFSSSVCNSFSFCSCSPATLLSSGSLLFRVFCLASSTKGLTKFVRSVQQRQSMNTSSSSCSLVWGRGSLATWSRADDKVMPNDDALRGPKRCKTEMKA